MQSIAMRCSYAPLVTTWVYLLSYRGEERLARACFPSQSRNLNDILEEGLRSQRQEDRVTLTFPPSNPPESLLRRPRPGEDASFDCQVPAAKDVRSIAWLHQNRPIFEGGRVVPRKTGGQQYRFSISSPTFTLTIVNVTLQSSGTVVCVDAVPRPHYSPEPPMVFTQYTLLPLVSRASEVLVPVPMAQQSARAGQNLTIPCNVRLPLSDAVVDNFRNHFMWRHNGQVVYAPTEPPYAALWPTGLRRPYLTLFDRFESYRPGATASFYMTLESTTADVNGYVECWFRPHAAVHEWIVQRSAVVIGPPAPAS
ncbi:uncharacterized protein LOC129602683 [Paramacrobiotus metropolitanus]|uniref:uncharacterized protein LOC129602683 n=1 Tax=Paramacrobiotus metropolitanus TaxID=2943436 RepID=UPI002445F4BA|nr:uncharacterized protein LOC129602683 [Paramacrobiotus metropolitanus]